MADINEELLDATCFLGDTLGPLFLYDPADALVAPLYEQLAVLDPKAAADDWPLVNSTEALPPLELIVGSFGDEAASLKPIPSDALVWEYRRLFVGPAAKAAPPWGSVYTDRECVIFGRSTLALREWLRRVGVDFLGESALMPAGTRDGGVSAVDASATDASAPDASATDASAPDASASDTPATDAMSNEPEDHIGIMLLLMSWLARNKPELLGEYLSEHLLTWAPHFLQLVQSQADHPFFKGLGQLTELSLAGLEEALQLKVSIPRFYR